MKENHEQAIKSYLKAASNDAQRRDFGNAFSYLRLIVAVFESEGFDVESLMPEKSYSALMESLYGDKQIDLSIDEMMNATPLHPLVHRRREQ